jgi:LPS export ABC transporter protein LptC
LRTHVKALKYIILVFTFVLLGVLLVYTQPQNSLVPLLQEKYGLVDTEDTQSQAEVIKQGLAGTKVEEVQETVMNQPNYLGEDENKKLWSLKAQRAVQVGDLNSGTTQLTSVIANTLSLKDSKVDYFADEGDFISAEEKIVLRGNVKIKSDKLELSTQTLDYNLKTGYAESKTQVDILADFGNIIGDSMQSYDNAEKIVLIGNVRAKLYNK